MGPCPCKWRGRGKVAWSRHRKWLRFSGFSKCFPNYHWVWAWAFSRVAQTLPTLECTDGKQVAQVAPGSPLHLMDVTNESQHSLQRPLNLASECFCSRPPSSLTHQEVLTFRRPPPCHPFISQKTCFTCAIAGPGIQAFLSRFSNGRGGTPNRGRGGPRKLS